MGMLVMTRRRDEEIVIVCPDGARLRIVACENREDRTKIGVEAPPQYIVNRKEVQERVDAEVAAGVRVAGGGE